jgi:purine nucleosidase
VTQTSLIFDCDPGVDDAIALFLAFASPELDILAITTVGGNVGGELTARNARLIREIAGREDVPVIAGCARPVIRELVDAGHFHGDSGLGTLPVFEPDAPLAPGHAAQFMVDAVMSRPAGSVTLAITGPMTNLAVALALEPAIAERLGPVVIMGGARSEGGNITASAEYNIYADPEGAQRVVASGCEIIMLGLDATHQVRATAERQAAIAALDTPQARATTELLRFLSPQEVSLGTGGAPPMHDPCVIGYILNPALFETRPCALQVECASPLTLGHTAVEFRLKDPAASRVHWAVAADDAGFFALLTERLSRAPGLPS